MVSVSMVVFLLVAVSVVWALIVGGMKMTMRRMQWRIETLSSFYAEQEGTILTENGYIDYHLQTIDCGNTWYALDKDGKIIGDVREVHPGLLETIALYQFAVANNPNQISRKRGA